MADVRLLFSDYFYQVLLWLQTWCSFSSWRGGTFFRHMVTLSYLYTDCPYLSVLHAIYEICLKCRWAVPTRAALDM